MIDEGYTIRRHFHEPLDPERERELREQATHARAGTKPVLKELSGVETDPRRSNARKELNANQLRILRKAKEHGMYAVSMDSEEYNNKINNREDIKLLIVRYFLNSNRRQVFEFTARLVTVFQITKLGERQI